MRLRKYKVGRRVGGDSAFIDGSSPSDFCDAALMPLLFENILNGVANIP
jgi:hypothetical protein